jgi:hypothetical protein
MHFAETILSTDRLIEIVGDVSACDFCPVETEQNRSLRGARMANRMAVLISSSIEHIVSRHGNVLARIIRLIEALPQSPQGRAGKGSAVISVSD